MNLRCFVAIPAIEPARSALDRLLRALPPSPADLKLVSPHQLHVTLKFLGDLRDSDIPRACDIVNRAGAGLAPFTIEIAGVGCFPNDRAPRVLWAGVNDPAGVCRDWVRRADPAFTEIGVDPERRPYSPHITLARARTNRGAALIRDWLSTPREFPPVPMTVVRIVLYESRPDRNGAVYAPLATVALGKS